MSMTKILLALSVCAVLSVPAAHAANFELQAVDKDCWVEIFDKSNFNADHPHIKIMGPMEIATLKNFNGRDWDNEIDSLVVGPSATVRAYKDRDFKGTEAAFTPNQRVADLGKLKMGNDIESMRILCGASLPDDGSRQPRVIP